MLLPWSHRQLFKGVPGPSPWYLLHDGPVLPEFTWQSADVTGNVVLRGPAGPVLLVGMYHYVTVVEAPSLLIWNQPYKKQSPTSLPVNFIILDPAQLLPLGDDISALCETMKQRQLGLLYDTGPFTQFTLDTTVVDEARPFTFPTEIESIVELLLLCHSSGIGVEPPVVRDNLALLVAHPRASTYRLYPQDWFNHGDYDFGYQWPTRVVRHPRTGRIHGEGMRIPSFVLDKTLRQLA